MVDGMSNSTDNTWPTIRIGISPFYPSVNPCVLDTNPKACKKQNGVGIELEILIIVLNLLKLRPKFILSLDSYCGDVKIFNQSYFKATGLFNMLLKDEIDITGNICGISEERLLFANSSYPVYYSKQVFSAPITLPKLKPMSKQKFDVLRGRGVESFRPSYIKYTLLYCLLCTILYTKCLFWSSFLFIPGKYLY